ncbi:hypothetical protein ACFLQ7_04035, partial [Actinomycetota bacterium]
MSRNTITTRMQTLRIDVDPDVEERHIASVLRELRFTPDVPVALPVPRRARRRLLVTVAAAFALLVPAAALAAEGAVPGDVLYPVKQSTEWVRSLVDPGIGQQHRVRELEIVIDRGAPIEVVTERFDASVDAVEGQDPELIRRVEIARQTVRDRYGIDLEHSTPTPGSQDSPRDPDIGGEPDPDPGTQQRNRDGAIGGSSPTTTSAPSTTTSTEPPNEERGAGA